jgi:hypothetical protein
VSLECQVKTIQVRKNENLILQLFFILVMVVSVSAKERGIDPDGTILNLYDDDSTFQVTYRG